MHIGRKINIKDLFLYTFCSACEAAVTGLIDLFLLGVDVETIENALEVHLDKKFEVYYERVLSSLSCAGSV